MKNIMMLKVTNCMNVLCWDYAVALEQCFRLILKYTCLEVFLDLKYKELFNRIYFNWNDKDALLDLGLILPWHA